MFAALLHSDSAAPTRINIVALILRAGLAVIFLYHGLDKITKGDAGASWASQMYAEKAEVPQGGPHNARSDPPQVPATLTYASVQLAIAWGEFLGGLALAIGVLTRLAALGLIIIQIGAVVIVTAPRGFHFEGGGYEYNVALLAMCVALLILGAGMWSVDYWLVQTHLRAVRQAATSAPPAAAPHAMTGAPTEPVAPGQPRPM